MFSTRLEQLRAQAHQTQNEFAQHLGIPLRTYSSWVSRKNKPSNLALPAIAHKCGVTVDWLTGHEHFGRRVRKFREARGWTQIQFVKKYNAAHDAGIDECWLIDVENENARVVDDEDMGKIVAILGVSKEEFLGADVPAECVKTLAPKSPAPSAHCPNCERLMTIIEHLSEALRVKGGGLATDAPTAALSATSSPTRLQRKAV